MNNRYRLFAKKVFEGMEKFENRLNEKCRKGWKPISMTFDNGSLIVLLEKTS